MWGKPTLLKIYRKNKNIDKRKHCHNQLRKAFW